MGSHSLVNLVRMIFKLFYYILLTPFNPLKFFKEFDQEEKSRKMATAAIVAALILLTAVNVLLLRSSLDIRGTGYMLFIFSLLIGKVVALFMLLGALTILGALIKVKIYQGRAALAIIGFSILPDIGSLIAAFHLVDQMFYVYWLMMVWKATIVTLGIFALTEITITNAILISVGSFVLIYFFQNTIYSMIPIAIAG